jgi:Kef-type K+ transport system membrane component KefB/nucleotide-binding universal stress UspA family protein
VTPLSEHQLLVFWVQLAVLVTSARLLGELMRRLGQPAVIGELAAGVLVGPSVLGFLAPGVFAWLFPVDPVQSGLLLAVAWVGVALLLVVTGFETDLELLADLGRQAASVATGSLVLPLVLGFGLGWILPATLIGPEGDRITFAAFAAVALAISALPVIARILIDLHLIRRNLGQVTIAAAMANDLVGWLLLGTIAGVVAAGGFDLAGLLTTVLAIGVFFGLALTVGQRLTDRALRSARKGEYGVVRSLTVVIVVALVAGAVTQAIGVEAVLGAFVAGIVLGRSRYQRREVLATLESVTHAFVAPVFFATAGLFMDLTLLADPELLRWALIVIAVAAVAKLAGSYVGARVGGLSSREGLVIGMGLNARGALEIVVATIGLGLGVLNDASYTIVVLMAMVTSMMAPPLMRWLVSAAVAPPEEAARLEREEMMQQSVVMSTRTALLPTRGGDNSILAGRILDLSVQPETAVTIYTVRAPGADPAALEAAEAAVVELQRHFGSRSVDRIDRSATDTATAICTEASLGYGLVAVGMTGQEIGVAPSPVLQAMLARCPVPLLLVRHGERLDPHAAELRFRRIVVPAVGTRPGRAAQEIAYTLATRVGAAVDAVHVVNRPDRIARVAVNDPRASSYWGVLGEAEELARRFGCAVNLLTRSGPSVGQELTHAVAEVGADLVVLGARVRISGGEPFLGHGVEYLLEHADATVLVFVMPDQAGG